MTSYEDNNTTTPRELKIISGTTTTPTIFEINKRIIVKSLKVHLKYTESSTNPVDARMNFYVNGNLVLPTELTLSDLNLRGLFIRNKYYNDTSNNVYQYEYYFTTAGSVINSIKADFVDNNSNNYSADYILNYEELK